MKTAQARKILRRRNPGFSRKFKNRQGRYMAAQTAPGSSEVAQPVLLRSPTKARLTPASMKKQRDHGTTIRASKTTYQGSLALT